MAENVTMPINSLCCYLKTQRNCLLKSEMDISSWVVADFSIYSFVINIICDIYLDFYLYFFSRLHIIQIANSSVVMEIITELGHKEWQWLSSQVIQALIWEKGNLFFYPCSHEHAVISLLMKQMHLEGISQKTPARYLQYFFWPGFRSLVLTKQQEKRRVEFRFCLC